jgi:5'/3'-nucleotidase SurE
MRFGIVALFPLAASAVNIISSNDDGWAEANIRAFFESLQAADHSVVVSAPAENQSGKGMCYAVLHSALLLTRHYRLKGRRADCLD